MPARKKRNANRSLGLDASISRQVDLPCPLDSDVVSCSGSVGSQASRMSRASVVAKNAVLLAELKERQLMEELRLDAERKMLKARHETSLAKLQLKLAEEAEGLEGEVGPVEREDKTHGLSSFLNDCDKNLREQTPSVFPMVSEKPGPSVMLRMDLPKLELVSFDGNPKDYCKFIRQFEYFVEAKVPDDGQRLLFLLHYCSGKAREAIAECVMLPPSSGYPRARKILQEFFGESHVVAKAHLDSLLANLRPVSITANDLTSVALRMQNCDIALSQLGCASELDSLSIMERIVESLPCQLQHQWARQTSGRSGLIGSTFRELTEFVSNEASIARSRFGQLAARAEASTRNPPRQMTPIVRRNVHLTRFNTLATGHIKCPLCESDHTLDCCKEFLSAEVKNRWAVVREHDYCLVCLQSGHHARDCNSKSMCSIPGCQRRHHPLLHGTKVVQTSEVSGGRCAATSTIYPSVSLGVLPVRVRGPRGTIETYALLDNGSDVTLVERGLLGELGIPMQPTALVIETVGGVSSVDSEASGFEVYPIKGSEPIRIDRAFTVGTLFAKPLDKVNSECIVAWPHLRDVPLAPSIKDSRVRLLIGTDVPEAHWTLEERIGNRKEPYAVKTLLGWVVRGPFNPEGNATAWVNNVSSRQSIPELLRLLYDGEFQDNHSSEPTMSQDDERALRMVRESITTVNGHYQVGMPWKQDYRRLPNNFDIALCRLRSLRSRFLKDQGFFIKYKESIERNLERGYASLVPGDQLDPDFTPRWYLPHHAVTNPKKPGKFRVVLDCASKCRGISLNDMLLQGPDVTSRLVGVLMRFRSEPVAVVADVEEMFMQVAVPERDRGALRFLWWSSDNLSEAPKEYQMNVHPFGATSSPFCASFALRQTASGVEGYNDLVLNSVRQNFYVDDCLISFKTVEEAQVFVQQIRKLLGAKGFKLKKWISNHREALDSIPPGDLAQPVTRITDRSQEPERTLGLEWNTEEDKFHFRLDITDKPSTRRGILSIVSSLYDPLGLVSPALLPAKILLQQLCRDGLGWDEPINSERLSTWQSWLNFMEDIYAVDIPRCIQGTGVGDQEPQLHVFCDASEVGYGAVAYARYTPMGFSPFCSILFSKSRVAPLKTVTIPRLELAAAKLAVCIAEDVRSEMRVGFSETFFWTDSSIVLHYINNTTSRFSVFVANRLSVIHEHTSPSQWRHVRSDSNPADFASRGVHTTEELGEWVRGPKFLLTVEESWPVSSEPEVTSAGLELKQPSRACCKVSRVDEFPLLSRFSEWNRLLRAVAWLTRFKSYVICRAKNVGQYDAPNKFLTAQELDQAQRDVVRMVQRLAFPDELARLTKSSNAAHTRPEQLKGSLMRLNPTLIDGIICLGGRLTYTNYEQSMRHPAILPKGSLVTELIIRYYHVTEGHCGWSQVLAATRRKFWILQGGTTVKRVVGSCINCRRRLATPCNQLMAPLPLARAEAGRHPFSQVGIDYFGPFPVKRGRAMEKRYGCLFTCLQTRAIHLEVAHTLTTDSFILVLTRFIARRGCPTDIYSDNGTNFVGAVKELRELVQGWNESKLNNYLSQKGTQWHFQPPCSSHRGGIWERMIRSVRRILNAICGEQPLTDETLPTFLTEVERILNNRPLVPATSDSRDEVALTPNHLILLRGNTGLESLGDLAPAYNKRWRQVLYLSKVFWRRWIKEYIPTLQKRQKWLKEERNLKLGDLVLVTSEITPRNQWPLGVIVDCKPSKDLLVRQVTVRTRGGNIQRDVRKLCLLEGNG